jgi:hypothetical protein
VPTKSAAASWKASEKLLVSDDGGREGRWKAEVVWTHSVPEREVKEKAPAEARSSPPSSDPFSPPVPIHLRYCSHSQQRRVKKVRPLFVLDFSDRPGEV